MQARRDEGRSSILKNEELSITDYSLEAARRDLIAYFFAGTLPPALQEIQQEAATKSAAATAATVTGKASKLAFTQVPNGTAGVAFPVQVQVQDDTDKVVTGATDSITISSSPSGVTGTLTTNAASGVATFSVTFSNAGIYTLSATAAGLASATSSPITIVMAGGTPPPTPTPAPTPPVRATQGLY